MRENDERTTPSPLPPSLLPLPACVTLPRLLESPPSPTPLSPPLASINRDRSVERVRAKIVKRVPTDREGARLGAAKGEGGEVGGGHNRSGEKGVRGSG